MARIYTTRQRLSDKRFDMSVGSDEESWAHPIGYCAGWKDWTKEDADRIHVNYELLIRDQEKLLPHKEKFHKDGHATAKEAADCWRQYRLDNEFETYQSDREQHRCQICNVWTGGVVLLGRDFTDQFFLCSEHAIRSVVETLTQKIEAV